MTYVRESIEGFKNELTELRAARCDGCSNDQGNRAGKNGKNMDRRRVEGGAKKIAGANNVSTLSCYRV